MAVPAEYRNGDVSLPEDVAEIKRLRGALNDAWGEAYMGALIGDDTPTPLAACLNVIDVCHKAIADATSRNEAP